MKCKNCNQPVNQNDLRCPHCGSKDYRKENNEQLDYLIMLILLLVTTVIIFIIANFNVEYNVDFFKDYNELFGKTEIFKEDTTKTIQNLEYIIPQGFENFIYETTGDYYRVYDYYLNDYKLCDMAISVYKISTSQTLEEQIKSSIQAALTDEVSETTIKTINNIKWYTFNINTNYETRYIYYTKHNSDLYNIKINVKKDAQASCEKKVEQIVNSLKLK